RAIWWTTRIASTRRPGLAIARCSKAAPGPHAPAWRITRTAISSHRRATTSWRDFAPVPGKDTCAMPAVISPAHERVILDGVCWHTYECLLADFADSHAVRVAYDRGVLEIMAPSYAHEELNHLIARVVEIIALEMDMDFINAGSTTFKREDLERGF